MNHAPDSHNNYILTAVFQVNWITQLPQFSVF